MIVDGHSNFSRSGRKKIRYDFVKKPEVALLLFKKLSTTLNIFFQKYIITSINFCDL